LVDDELKILIHPLQRKMFLKYVEVFQIEDRKTVIAVSNQDEAREMAEQIARRL
jgi:hypothetical protein